MTGTVGIIHSMQKKLRSLTVPLKYFTWTKTGRLDMPQSLGRDGIGGRAHSDASLIAIRPGRLRILNRHIMTPTHGPLIMTISSNYYEKW
ncbi:MAG: hypothetical protein V3R78_06390 [Thermodesulfobacteriota bacterium]